MTYADNPETNPKLTQEDYDRMANEDRDRNTHPTLNINVMPVSRIIVTFKNQGMAEKLKLIGQEVWLAELLTVSKGDRRCATYHVRSDHLLQDMLLLADLGLHFEPLQEVRRTSGFAHKHYKPVPNEPYDLYGVVTKKRKYALKWKEAHNASPTDHITMSEFLSYPECDATFFNDVWGTQSLDPVWEAALNSKHTRIDEFTIEMPNLVPEANILPRYFGLRAVPQIVCSFNCEANIEYSKMFLKYIPHADLIMELLSQPYTWDCYRGIAMLYADDWTGLTNSVAFKDRHIVRIGEAK